MAAGRPASFALPFCSSQISRCQGGAIRHENPGGHDRGSRAHGCHGGASLLDLSGPPPGGSQRGGLDVVTCDPIASRHSHPTIRKNEPPSTPMNVMSGPLMLVDLLGWPRRAAGKFQQYSRRSAPRSDTKKLRSPTRCFRPPLAPPDAPSARYASIHRQRVLFTEHWLLPDAIDSVLFRRNLP